MGACDSTVSFFACAENTPIAFGAHEMAGLTPRISRPFSMAARRTRSIAFHATRYRNDAAFSDVAEGNSNCGSPEAAWWPAGLRITAVGRRTFVTEIKDYVCYREVDGFGYILRPKLAAVAFDATTRGSCRSFQAS